MLNFIEADVRKAAVEIINITSLTGAGLNNFREIVKFGVKKKSLYFSLMKAVRQARTCPTETIVVTIL